MARAPVLPLAIWIGCLTAAAVAQVRLQGRVIEDVTETPVEGTRVTLLDARGRQLSAILTDQRGAFEFLVRRTGAVRLRAERIGFAETVTPTLHFDQHDFFSLEIRLDPEAVLLAPLEVVARSPNRISSVLREFEDRRMRATGGVFFTRKDIDRLNPGYVSDLLATVPGVHLETSGGRRNGVVTMGRRLGCPAQIYVDGFLINPRGDHAIDEVVLPPDIEGIEVYRGLSTVPAEFLSPEAECGVVVLWTRRGGHSDVRDSNGQIP